MYSHIKHCQVCVQLENSFLPLYQKTHTNMMDFLSRLEVVLTIKFILKEIMLILHVALVNLKYVSFSYQAKPLT